MASHPQNPIGRRGFFRALREWAVEEGKALAEPFIEDFIESVEPVVSQIAGPEVVRPPGAIDERAFRETCTGCGDCVRACPENAILPAPQGLFPDFAGTPVIIPRRRACVMCDPIHCAVACPSGALVDVAREAMRIGTARVMPALCFAHQGQDCDTCHAVCPERGKAIVIRRRMPEVNPAACTGCGLCEYACPAHPAAIRVQTRR